MKFKPTNILHALALAGLFFIGGLVDSMIHSATGPEDLSWFGVIMMYCFIGWFGYIVVWWGLIPIAVAVIKMIKGDDG